MAGPSWESFVTENLLRLLPQGGSANFYRTAAGAEIDLVLTLPGGQRWAVEIKRSSAPRLARGFHQAGADLQPTRRFVVYPGTERFPLNAETEVLSLPHLVRLLQMAGG